MSDDADFVGSVLSFTSIGGSPRFAFSLLLGLSVGGGEEFTSGVFLSLSLGTDLVDDGNELLFRISSSESQVLSLFSDLSNEGFEVDLSLGFSFSVVDDGLLKGSSEFTNLVRDGLELFGGEGGSEGDEGEDGVFTTDSVEFSEDGFSIGFRGDGTELGSDDVKSLNDLGGLDLSGLEGFVVLSSGVSELFLLFVEDVELGGLGFDVSLEELLGGGELVDLVGGFSDFVGSEVDSSVVSVDFSLTFNLVSSVLKIGILLLEDEILSQLLEHLGDVSKGSLVLELEGDGIEELSSHVRVLKLLELSIDHLVGV